MQSHSVELPVGPLGIRLFIGYRAATYKAMAGDDAATAEKKRTGFFTELGTAFFPGTPIMQAPLGLAAYVPAVLDPAPDSGLPDEVAAIVYASREVYDRFREKSISRRMYTRAHPAVFDMVRSVAQFPLDLTEPNVVDANGSPHTFAFLSPTARVDWQTGATRIALLAPNTPHPSFQTELVEKLKNARAAAAALGVDQILLASANGFAALWIHSVSPLAEVLKALDLVPEAATIIRDLETAQFVVASDMSPTPAVTGPGAFTFRFERRLELFEPTP